MSEDSHDPEDCPMREGVKVPPPEGKRYSGKVRMSCMTCGLEFHGTLKPDHPMVEGKFIL